MEEPESTQGNEYQEPEWPFPLLEGLEAQGHNGDCPYPCPVCTGIKLAKQMRPDVVEHLFAAGREFMLAARAFLEGVSDARYEGSDPPQVPRIPFD